MPPDYLLTTSRLPPGYLPVHNSNIDGSNIEGSGTVVSKTFYLLILCLFEYFIWLQRYEIIRDPQTFRWENLAVRQKNDNPIDTHRMIIGCSMPKGIEEV